ncbi:aspartate aminotransferase family protein [Stella sp.]|uniref:aspartate aminotransferase family protein n=1 Tax=Stella sp. TaxID=2912054 RepID=UPI0035AE859B
MISPVMPTYARVDLAFERGDGAYLYATDGRRFLDFCSGIAVTCLGHNHPHLQQALIEQAQKVWHVSNLWRIPQGERLAERLVARTFADTMFFTNSGAEANECAIKLVRKYHDETGNPGRFRIITAEAAFHGRTMTTIAATGGYKYTKGFEPIPEGFDHVAFANTNEMRAAIRDDTAAILVEPVQGEGGIRPATVEYLRELRAICDEFGLLLVFDEVQCGIGRTGKLFAHEWAGITPDVMTIAKGIGGGFPMGACLATEKAAVGLTAGTHGSTFGGNPLAMAVGNAVLDVVLSDGFLERVERMGGVLRNRLADVVAKYPKVVAEVRGAGLMLGLRCEVPGGDFGTKLRENGLLTVGAGENVVRLLPPLIIGEGEIDEAVAIVEKTCREWTH